MSRCSALCPLRGRSLGGRRRIRAAAGGAKRLLCEAGWATTSLPSPRVCRSEDSGGVVGSGPGVAIQPQPLWLATPAPLVFLGRLSDSQHPPPCSPADSSSGEQQQEPPPSAPIHIEAAASGCSTSCNATISVMSRDLVGWRAMGSRSSFVKGATLFLPVL